VAEGSLISIRKNVSKLEDRAHQLSEQMPEILVDAKRVAHTVAHGIHGRRRRGPGETFWQFRHYEDSDTAGQIDWRRSASSDALYVREREWEAAHTVWLWPDLSPSMDFQSHLSDVTKFDRTLVLTFALAELLVQGGERVGIAGHMLPTSSRMAVGRLADTIVQLIAQSREGLSLPPLVRLNPHAEFVSIGDFLDPQEKLSECFETIASQGIRGHLVQIFDPAEETLPYTGRTLFESREGKLSLLTGRAENLREGYIEKLRNHRIALDQLAKRMEWSYLIHHTDRPAGEALLALHTKLTGQDDDYRVPVSTPSSKRKEKQSSENGEGAHS